MNACSCLSCKTSATAATKSSNLTLSTLRSSKSVASMLSGLFDPAASQDSEKGELRLAAFGHRSPLYATEFWTTSALGPIVFRARRHRTKRFGVWPPV